MTGHPTATHPTATHDPDPGRTRPAIPLERTTMQHSAPVVEGPPSTRALVIDDDPVSLTVVEHLLTTRADAQVTTAAGPEEGLEHLRTAPFDVVVTDVQMPGMTGLELMTQLHATTPGLPVIVITAQRGLDAALEVIRSEADAFVFKPLDPDKLVGAVHRVTHPEPAPAPARPRVSHRRWFRRR